MVTLTNPDGSAVEVSEEHAGWIESVRTGVAARAAAVEQQDEDAARARGDLKAAARHRAERLRSLACARRYRASWKRVTPAPRAPQLAGVIDTRPTRARARGAGRPARRPATRAASGDDGDGPPPLPPAPSPAVLASLSCAEVEWALADIAAMPRDVLVAAFPAISAHLGQGLTDEQKRRQQRSVGILHDVIRAGYGGGS